MPVVILADTVPRQRVRPLVKYLYLPLRIPVLYLVVDGEGDTFHGVLQVGLRDRAVVKVDCGAGTALLQRSEVGDLVLAAAADHAVLDGGARTLHEDGAGCGVL